MTTREPRIEIMVFGTDKVPKTRPTRELVEELTENDFSVKYAYYDMETAEGIAEGQVRDVKSLPATLLLKFGAVFKRWDRYVPPKGELSKAIEFYKELPTDLEIRAHKTYLGL
jgi:hypothetical protein